MSPKPKSKDAQIIELKAENKRLRRQLGNARATKTQGIRWQRIIIGLLVGFAGALLVVGNLVFWTGQTLINTDRYAEITQPLIENADIQNAIVQKTSDAIFSRIDLEQVAQNALPPRAQFLAPSLATGVENFTDQQLTKAVRSEKFQETWQQVNTAAHQRLITGIRNYDGDGTFNISDLYNKLSQRLADTKLSFLANKSLPANIANITIVSAPNLPRAHWVVVNLWWVRLMTIGLFVGLTVLAVYLAQNKRRMLVQISILNSALLLTSLVALRVTRTMFVNQVSKDYQAAANAAWHIILQPLVVQTVALIAVFAIVAVAAWLGGSGKKAQRFRRTIVQLLNGKFHQVVFRKENAISNFVGSNYKVLQSLVLVCAGICLLIIRLNLKNVLLLGIITVLLSGALVVLRSPQRT